MATGYYLLDNPQRVQQYLKTRRNGRTFSGTIVIHTAECAIDNVGPDTAAEGVARYFTTRSDYGAYHRLVDSDSIIKAAPFDYEVFQDQVTNNWAVGISAAVSAGKWNTIEPARRDRIYRHMAVCAAEAVEFAKTKGITVPIKRISGADARAAKPGLVAHGDCGINRTDPGTQFDWDLFLRYVREELDDSKPTTIEEDPVPNRVKLTRNTDTKLPKGKWAYLRYSDDKTNNVSVLIAKVKSRVKVGTDLKVVGIPAGKKIQARYVVENYDAKGNKVSSASLWAKDIVSVDGKDVSWRLTDDVDLAKGQKLRLQLHSDFDGVAVTQNTTVVDHWAL